MSNVTRTGDRVLYSLEGKTLKLDTAEDAKQYADEIRGVEGLTEIKLSGNTFGVEAGRAIALALKDQHALKVAGLADMFTSRLRNEIPLVLDALVEALEDKKNLVELDLSDNAFGPAGAEPLQRLLINNRNIQILRFYNNGLGIEGARLVSAALVKAAEKNKQEGRPSSLRVIYIGRNRMESKGVEHLCKAFEAHGESLREIRMPQNSIRPEGITALMTALASCKNLEHLDLQDNTFTEGGSDAIAKVLPTWTNLKVLHIGDCLLGEKGAKKVLRALTPGHSALEKLHLAFNEIDPEGAGLIPTLLSNKKNLTLLELNGNAFDPEGDAVRDIKRALLELGQEGALDELDEMEWDEEEEEEEEEEEADASGKEEEEDADVDALTAATAKLNV
ncbi:uncharacterized protein EV422DRAFT_427949 [Fimicolochytrium jonesii]|uniref:uncharacterized protein n=1 Tax=Fimicolochytrium jonesii TaxID=1396493 RepID=UPI0022FE02AF|nr:uncharacterized protein EV422DRAFT_427949 [Fimicolochytrium jonesii]KAI8821679.1 hypothetical protein EV422DRAFT_427949 [Fimicolochytrium jonesii]